MGDSAFVPLLRRLIRAADRLLRLFAGVTEFEECADGLVRIGKSHANRSLSLPDGTCIRPGAPILNLHFWNEHLPSFPSAHGEPDWTLRVTEQLRISLVRLANYMAAHSYFGDAQALRATLSVPRLGPPSTLAHVVQATGFESHARTVRKRTLAPCHVHAVWAWLLTWTYNPRALFGWRFDRVQQEFWISRGRFFNLYGGNGESPPPPPDWHRTTPEPSGNPHGLSS